MTSLPPPNDHERVKVLIAVKEMALSDMTKYKSNPSKFAVARDYYNWATRMIELELKKAKELAR